MKIGPNFVGSLFLNFSKAVRIHFILDQTVETVFLSPSDVLLVCADKPTLSSQTKYQWKVDN